MPQPTVRVKSLAMLVLLLTVFTVAARAQDVIGEARALFATASAAYQKGADARDQAAQDAAAADLHKALELFNAHLDAHPEDAPQHEATLTEINALLFWHGRMRAPDLWGEDDSPTAERDREIEKERRARELAEARETEAARMLEVARKYGQDHEDDLYGRRIEMREILIQFPDTTAADTAQAEIETLDELITAREAAVEVATEAAGGKVPTQEQVEDAEALAVNSATLPWLHLLRTRLDTMKGSEAERYVLGRIRELFARRRFIEAQEECRQELINAAAPGDQGRIDRIGLGLARAVTIMDHAVNYIGSRVGEDERLGLIGGASFSGKLEGLTWNAIVLRTEEASVHVPYFRLSDGTLVRLAAETNSVEAALAAAAFLALAGDGSEAIGRLNTAERLGAAKSEVEALRHLAGDEKAKRDLEREIKKESRRWKRVVSLEKKMFKAYKSAKYLDFLKAILRAEKKTGLTDLDLAWLSDRAQDAVGQPLQLVIRSARETCKRQHQSETRLLTCPQCQGVGTILTKSPGGLFGVKKRQQVRVRCPMCTGKQQISCPECYDRFHDKGARELQKRAGISGHADPQPEETADPPSDGGGRR